MSLELTGPWRVLDAANIAALPGQLGVYQIADAAGTVLFIGFAGGHSAFGLRGALAEEAQRRRADAQRFQYEVTMQYASRWEELLMAHVARAGTLPADNAARGIHPRRLGRLSPA